MFSIPGICGLLVVLIARPQEFLPALQRIPLLYLLCGVAMLGLVLDWRLRRLQPLASPAFNWAMLFWLWVIICDAFTPSSSFVARAIEVAILLVFFSVLSLSVQRFRTFQTVAGTLLATCVFVSIVCFHQGMQPKQCLVLDASGAEGTPSGFACEENVDCKEVESLDESRCEHFGWFGTYSIEDRVRYRGQLNDPNEVAMTICCLGLSFALAFMIQDRRARWRVGGGLLVLLIVLTVFRTGSRGGLLVMMGIPGAYAIKRYGLKALVLGGAAGGLVFMLGARGGGAADESTLLRYEAWAEGFAMLRSSPIFGIGHRLFTENHGLTAHNSYVLTLAELGVLGFVLFVSVIYMSIKTIYVGLKRLEGVPGAGVARTWGMSMLASLCGMSFQISTLSFSYHSVLWIIVGMGSAWYSAVRHHDPEFVVRMTLRDFVTICAICFGYAGVFLQLFLRYKHVI
ncbi:MAG: O-antigen ligase family protein [Kofleriaceae bacterium]